MESGQSPALGSQAGCSAPGKLGRVINRISAGTAEDGARKNANNNAEGIESMVGATGETVGDAGVAEAADRKGPAAGSPTIAEPAQEGLAIPVTHIGRTSTTEAMRSGSATPSANPDASSGTRAVANIRATGVPPQTPQEVKAKRKERRERARRTKSAQIEAGSKSGKHASKRGGIRSKHKQGARMKEEPSVDNFDAWVGTRLKAWLDGEAAPEGNDLPPEDSGIPDEIRFDPREDEIEFPTTLSALQRRQVHGWAMQLALFHASSGEDAQRHVIVSKTGAFEGKHLTRGGRSWYKEGVDAPHVGRFALGPGHELEIKITIDALRSFHEGIQIQQSGFASWLAAHAPGPLDGSDIADAKDYLHSWPLLHKAEWELVDTPLKLTSLVEALDSCSEFAFDVEAHNARTYHGLTCLLQVSTRTKDYVVDPLAPGLWDCMAQLRKPFSNSATLKIGHSIRSCDVPSLYRDFGIVVVNAIDTEEAVLALGDKQTGLAKVLEGAGVAEQHDISALKQSMQACDWRERPLSPEKFTYARCDSHYLIPLWRFLRARLLAADTLASREDIREESELLKHSKREAESVRDRHSDHERPGELLSGPEAKGKPEALSASDRATCNDGDAFAPRGRSPSSRRIGSCAPLVDEQWASDWDNPETRHRHERSRSGSFFRSDLESIHESFGHRLSSSVRGDSMDRIESPGGTQDLAMTLQEIEDGEPQERAQQGANDHSAGADPPGEIGFPGGNDALASPPDTSGNSADGMTHDIAEDDLNDDEDEDMWDGWGQENVGSAATAPTATAPPPVQGEHMARSEDHMREQDIDDKATPAVALLSPPSADVSDSPLGLDHGDSTMRGAPSGYVDSFGESPETRSPSTTTRDGSTSGPPRQSEGQKTGGRRARRRGRSRRKGPKANMMNDQQMLQTDGIRLLWKALSRSQLATAALWQPVAEATRRDSHNERHFRTAVQRLEPPRWTDVNVRVYEDIFVWRDRTAKRLDDGPTYVCPGDVLIDVALALPTGIDALRRVSLPLSPVLGDADTPEAFELVNVVRLALGLAPLDEHDGQDDRGRRITAATASVAR